MGVGTKGDPRAVRGTVRELLSLAWPLIVSNSFWTLQIALDRVLLGGHHVTEVAAAMLAAMLYWTPFNLLFHTAGYATTFVAQYVGAGRPRRVGAVVWQALYFALFTGIAFIGLAPFAPRIVAWTGR